MFTIIDSAWVVIVPGQKCIKKMFTLRQFYKEAWTISTFQT